jgi:hypothetical protein
MVKNYWILFCLTLIGMIVCISLFVLGFLFAKKIFLDKKNGIILLILSSCISLALSVLCASTFSLCCKDYKYVSNNTYLEEKAKVVEFTVSRFDYDGSGRQEHRKPKFYLVEKEEYIVLNVIGVEVGETYIIRFYPNTKICDVIEKIS